MDLGNFGCDVRRNITMPLQRHLSELMHILRGCGVFYHRKAVFMPSLPTRVFEVESPCVLRDGALGLI